MAQPDLRQALIEIHGELVALRVTVQVLAGAMAVLTERGDALLEDLRASAQDNLNTQHAAGPGVPAAEIKARAEFMVDQMFDSLRTRGTPP